MQRQIAREGINMRRVRVSSPGRADFLNTHQDYKGLPVVPVAINLRMYLYGETISDRRFHVRSLDLEGRGEPSTDSFAIGINDMAGGKFFGDYLRGVVNVLVKRGLAEKIGGMKVTIKSDIPIGSGLSSSAALEVGFTYLLNVTYGLGLSRRDLAEIAFAAENEEVGIPCGRLDQYGVSYGGIVKLECRPPYRVERLPFRNLTFAIIDSGIRHSTADIHPRRQEEINRALRALMEDPDVPRGLKALLGYRFDEPTWENINEEQLEDHLAKLDEAARKRIIFTIRMQRWTEFALKILRGESIGRSEAKGMLGEERWRRISNAPIHERKYMILGEVMNEQHSLLRDLYDVSLPRLDEICSAALDAGAYGAKISGAGMGGSIIALVKDEEHGRNVINACLEANAREGWVSRVGGGVRLELDPKQLGG
ncbi:GHMP kinase [Candidatus Bathyarchaeota archaeon]|nr:MAG: GHMP kinase [Candidatus Bathyarchaeota archaeon]